MGADWSNRFINVSSLSIGYALPVAAGINGVKNEVGS